MPFEMWSNVNINISLLIRFPEKTKTWGWGTDRRLQSAAGVLRLSHQLPPRLVDTWEISGAMTVVMISERGSVVPARRCELAWMWWWTTALVSLKSTKATDAGRWVMFIAFFTASVWISTINTLLTAAPSLSLSTYTNSSSKRRQEDK